MDYKKFKDNFKKKHKVSLSDQQKSILNLQKIKINLEKEGKVFYTYSKNNTYRTGIIDLPINKAFKSNKKPIFILSNIFHAIQVLLYFIFISPIKAIYFFIKNYFSLFITLSSLLVGVFVTMLFLGLKSIAQPSSFEDKIIQGGIGGGFADHDINITAQKKELNEGELEDNFSRDEALKDKLLGEEKDERNKQKEESAPTSNVSLIAYKVKPGDTLSHISQKFNVSVDSIAGSSNIKYVHELKVGKILSIPTKEGIFYTVKPKDRLASIVNKYKINLDDVIDINPHMHPDVLEKGQQIFLIGAKPTNLIHSRWLMPVASRVITSDYGWRTWPRKAYHKGLDIKAIYTSVRTIRNGKVHFAGRLGGYGKVVVINHQNGYKSLYAHLSRIYVKKGQSVRQGKIIGRSGNTGYSFGPHLHLEISYHGNNINPKRILKGFRYKRGVKRRRK